MALETGTYISDLVAANPPNSDQKAQGAGHFRLLKSTIKATFPNITGAVTPTHTLLNTVGVTQAISDDSENTATTAFVQDLVAATAFTNALPAQTGNSGKFVTTDGSVASWDAISQVPSQTTHSGKFLTTNGTEASWASVQNGLTLLATLTPTAASSVDALTTFSASYDNYLIVGTGILPASDTILRVRFANAGAADTGSNYVARTAESDTSISGGVDTGMSITGTLRSGGYGVNFAINVCNVNSTSLIKSLMGKVAFNDSSGPSKFVMSGFHGIYTAANAVSGVRFYWNSGANFAASGTIRIYGISNS